MVIIKQRYDSMADRNSYIEVGLVNFHIPLFSQVETTGNTIYTVFS